MRAPASRTGSRAAARLDPDSLPSRVSPDARRRQLLTEAAAILTAQGVEHVQITEVAERAQVSRPLVYRLFPTRRALVQALLEDFAAKLSERFHQALLAGLPSTLDAITESFVLACCAAIEQEGAGPWLLLDARGVDPELARLGREILAELLRPWQRRLGELTALPPRRAANVMWVMVAAGRAALDGWIEGTVSRRAAVADATRAVTALLQGFMQQPTSQTAAQRRLR